ncbi:MAG: surface polysaccharide O-acyltransferase-like enzyme [Clostridium sp.]|jgi:surface polysaccharide O-acyltransferase-like enzyme
MINTTSTKERNCSIDIFRIICAIMVVAAHTHPLTDNKGTAGFIATMIIPRIAVPFFFCVAGFYYVKGLLAKKSVFIRNVKKLLMVYVIWSSIYFSIKFLVSVIKHHEPIGTFMKKFIMNFFINGSSYQLWYFPTLFFCIFVVTFFNKLKLLKFLAYCSILLYILGLLGCSYYSIGNKIPIIQIFINSHWFKVIRRFILMGLPFFMLGYFLNILEDKYHKISNKKLLTGWGITSVLFLVEIILVIKLNLQANIVISIFLYPLVTITMILLLNNPLPKKRILSYYTRGIANFIFYSHPIFIMVLGIVENKILHIEVIATPMFLITSVLTIISGWVFIKIDNEWLNSVFL